MQTAMLAGAQTAPAQCRAPSRRATAAMAPAASCGSRSSPLPIFIGFRQNSLQTAQVQRFAQGRLLLRFQLWMLTERPVLSTPVLAVLS